MMVPPDVSSCLKGPLEELLKYCSSEKLAALPDEEQPLAAPASVACQFRTTLKILENKISMLAQQKISADQTARMTATRPSCSRQVNVVSTCENPWDRSSGEQTSSRARSTLLALPKPQSESFARTGPRAYGKRLMSNA